MTLSYKTQLGMDKATRDLTPAVQRSLQGALDRMLSAYGSKKEQGAGATMSASVSVASVAELDQKVPFVPTVTAVKSSQPLETTKVSAAHVEAPVAVPAARKVVVEESVPDMSSSHWKKTNKNKRLEDFYKLNWPQNAEDIGETELCALKVTWEPLISSELLGVLFPEASKFGSPSQDSVLPAVDLLILQLDASSSQIASIMPHSDLILRWVAYSLSLRESSGALLKLLLLISMLFQRHRDADAQLHDAEVSIIVPMLAEKSGHKSDRHKTAFRDCLDGAISVTSPVRLCSQLIQGISSKNKKSRVVCIEVIDGIVESKGMVALNKTIVKDIGATIDGKDTDIYVRTACLDLCYTLYVVLGSEISKVFKIFGELSDRSIQMIEHKIKERKKIGGTTMMKAARPLGDDLDVSVSLSATAGLRDAHVSPSRLLAAAAPLRDVRTEAPAAAEGKKADPEAKWLRPPVVSTPVQKARPVYEPSAVSEFSAGLGMPFQLDITPPGSAHEKKDRPAMKVAVKSDEVNPAVRQVPAAADSAKELDGVFRDIFSNIDAVPDMHDLINRDPNNRLNIPIALMQNCKDYLKVLFSILSGTWSATASTVGGDNSSSVETKILQKYVGEITRRLIGSLRLSFQNASTLESPALSVGFDVGLTSVVLACLFTLVKNVPLVGSLGDESVVCLLKECARWLVDGRLGDGSLDSSLSVSASSAAADPQDVRRHVSKGLNMVLLQLTAGMTRGRALCCLIDVMTFIVSCDESSSVAGNILASSRGALPRASTKPISRLILKLLSEESVQPHPFTAPSVDCAQVLSHLHSFFDSHPATQPSDDTPYCCAKTVLSHMIRCVSVRDVMQTMRSMTPAVSPHSFLFMLAARIGGVAGADMAAQHREVGGEEHDRLVALIDNITTARDKMVPIKELHSIIKTQPDLNLDLYLQRISSTYRKYVIDCLHKLDHPETVNATLVQQNAVSKPVQATSAVKTSNSSGGAEALRILENLKAVNKSSQSRTFGSPLQQQQQHATVGEDISSLNALPPPPTKLYVGSPRSSILQDKVKGMLDSLPAVLLPPPTNAADGDLAARLNRLKKMNSENNARK